MKKKSFILLIATLFVAQLSFAQNNYVPLSGTKRYIPVSPFSFTLNDKNLSPKQMNLVDSLYANLNPGEAIRLSMLDESEKDLSAKEIAQLTYARAEAFVLFCREKNIPLTEFYAEIVPYSMPHTIRTTELTNRTYKTFMANNARTYFVFMRAEATATSKPSVNFDENFSADAQIFSMYNDRDMYAYLNSGTTVFIPKGSLQFANGQRPSCNKIEIRVAEYLDMDAIVMKSMTTSSYGKKLQTAGMWHINASCNGQQLFIKPGKQYHIYVNLNGSEVKDMRVFTGRKKDGLLEWNEETDSKVYKPGESVVCVEEIDIENDSTSIYRDGDVIYDSERNYETSGLGVVGYVEPSTPSTYDIALNDFGWINCDAFDNTHTLTNLLVNGADLKGCEVMLVYTKRKSVLAGYLCEDGRTIKFSDIATDEAAMLVVFKKTDDKGNVVKHIRVIDPSITTSVNVVTKESTLAELQAEIKGKLSDL